jgi:hypothetical protein
VKLNADTGKASGKPHAVVRGVDDALREISGWPGVESVVAGRISKIRHRYPALSVTVQMSTVSGLKCLARIGQAGLVLLGVTAAPPDVSARLKERWGAD